MLRYLCGQGAVLRPPSPRYSNPSPRYYDPPLSQVLQPPLPGTPTPSTLDKVWCYEIVTMARVGSRPGHGLGLVFIVVFKTNITVWYVVKAELLIFTWDDWIGLPLLDLTQILLHSPHCSSRPSPPTFHRSPSRGHCTVYVICVHLRSFPSSFIFNVLLNQSHRPPNLL